MGTTRYQQTGRQSVPDLLPVRSNRRHTLDDPWRFESVAWADGYERVAGVDEVGRGPLAGPVVAACVILPGDFDPSGITDSKKLTARAREVAYERITHGALAWALGMANAVEIDQINILRATHVSMARAIAALALPPDLLLIDGLPVPGLPCATQRALVGGDGLSVSIAAASIVAKVTRDRMMVEADKLYPEYGFAGHKGYGAKTHIAALLEHGPCPLHRRSFSPVAEAISRQFSME